MFPVILNPVFCFLQQLSGRIINDFDCAPRLISLLLLLITIKIYHNITIKNQFSKSSTSKRAWNTCFVNSKKDFQHIRKRTKSIQQSQHQNSKRGHIWFEKKICIKKFTKSILFILHQGLLNDECLFRQRSLIIPTLRPFIIRGAHVIKHEQNSSLLCCGGN